MITPASLRNIFNSRRGRAIVENLTAYLFIFPAGAIIFTFGIFPVAFAFFVSLHRWRRFPDEYRGLQNYINALGSMALVLFFWMALGLVIYAAYLLFKKAMQARADRRIWAYVVPGFINALAVKFLVTWFFRVLLLVLEVPNRMPRDEVRNRAMFIDEFLNSFSYPHVMAAADWVIVLIILGVGLSLARLWFVRIENRYHTLLQITLAFTVGLGGQWLLGLTLQEIDEAISGARAAGEELPIWSYIIFLTAGVASLFVSYQLWRRAVRQQDDHNFGLLAATALLVLIGGYLLIVQIPEALSSADDDLLQGFWVTVMYVVGTVPVQLSIGLGVAYLLFNASIGKSIFRMVYFLPYVTPFAATSLVFAQIFSGRSGSPANRLLTLFGIDEQRWIVDPSPINELILGRDDLPRIVEGPGLALVVIIIWATWTYIGYDAVIFMAGLGNISSEYYEAARIDGASGWAIFRHITLPLLSPTTFFLSLVAVIGTFQAFTQIWMMRRQGAYDAVDTVGVYLFDTVSSNSRYGYGSAMAFVLFGVILVITLLQNRALGRKVFYG